MASGGASEPGSWNRMAYVQGDPVNRADPTGMDPEKTFCDIYPDKCKSPPRPGGPDPKEPDPIPQNGSQVGAYGDPEGKVRALRGLWSISVSTSLGSETCTKFFAALAPEGVSFDTLKQQVRSVARSMAANHHIYDGPSSSTPLDPDKFPGAASPGVATVGEWFSAQPGSEALSQFNGDAVFIKFDAWDGLLSSYGEGDGASKYGRGTLLHEILHKQMVGGGSTHDQIRQALSSAGITNRTLGRNDISDRLSRACF